jgi:lipoate-protein ligase A
VALYDKDPIELEILPFKHYSGAENMAMDGQMAREHRDQSKALFRFYGWQPYCLSIGYHQETSIVNVAALEENGYHWIKRPTGGRAIFHAEELTYCAIFPHQKITPKSLYRLLHTCIALALQTLGYPVQLAADTIILPKLAKTNPIDSPCFTRSAPTEIRYGKKKLVGSAQRIYPFAILQHGSILIGNKHKCLPDFLLMKPEERNRMKQEMERRTICLADIKPQSGIEVRIRKAIVKQLEIIGNCLLNYKYV